MNRYILALQAGRDALAKEAATLRSYANDMLESCDEWGREIHFEQIAPYLDLAEEFREQADTLDQLLKGLQT